MLLVYTHTITPRLLYICEFILKEQLGISFVVTDQKEILNKHAGPILNYSPEKIEANCLHIIPQGILFQTSIEQQQVDCFETNNCTAFFKTGEGDFTFDIFGASFFLISRYEEYLPHQKDAFGRYDHHNSVAHRNGFLQKPLVNQWLALLERILKEKLSSLPIETSHFQFKPTYDIDIAWSYKNKGVIRNMVGFCRKPSVYRLKVMLGIEKDPFDSYDFLDRLHQEYSLHPIYFFLVSHLVGRYDKNISPFKKSMKRLIQHHDRRYTIGIHPSWKSNKAIYILQKEKRRLGRLAKQSILSSRQHYIKFSLPDTCQRLIQTDIHDEYSMGYPSTNGFRASVASSFYWYDLSKEEKTTLRIHPFCFMDATCFYYQKKSAEEAYSELMYYYQECKKVQGCFITIFHNNFLGTDPQFEGWQEMYARFISQVQP